MGNCMCKPRVKKKKKNRKKNKSGEGSPASSCSYHSILTNCQSYDGSYPSGSAIYPPKYVTGYTPVVVKTPETSCVEKLIECPAVEESQCPAVEKEAKCPAVEKAAECPAVEESECSAVEKVEECPAVEKEAQCPAVEKAAECSAVENVEECPAVEREAQCPAVEKAAERSAVEKVEEGPAVEKVEECPAVEKEAECPAVEKEAECSAVEKVEECPAVEKESECPAVEKEAECPAVEKEAECSAVEKEAECPAVEKEAECSAVEKEAQCPAVEKEAAKECLAAVSRPVPRANHKITQAAAIDNRAIWTGQSCISESYSLGKLLLTGVHGSMYQATCLMTDQPVAIKHLNDVFRNPRTSLNALRELRTLTHVQGHPNIIMLQDVVMDTNGMDLYLVFEFVATDLYHIIADGVDRITDYMKRYMVFQLVNAISFVHSAGIMHRDVKPSNILVNEQYVLKLCDFGLSRLVDDGPQAMTANSVSMHYRAPEVLLSDDSYSTPIDMWSIGCVAAELYIGTALFRGVDTKTQFQLIMAALPDPTVEELAGIRSRHITTALEVVASQPKTSLYALLKDIPADAMAMIQGLLQINPQARWSAPDTLRQKYLMRYFSYLDADPCNTCTLRSITEDACSIIDRRADIQKIIKKIRKGKRRKSRKRRKKSQSSTPRYCCCCCCLVLSVTRSFYDLKIDT